MNYTYLLRCADNSLYCGWTNHLEERVEAHNSGKGAKYTKAKRPVVLAYYEEFGTKEEAMKREAAIKKLSKAEKELLVKEAAGKQKKTQPDMCIIISPAKRMQVKNDDFPWKEEPVFIEEAGKLLKLLKTLKEPELKALFKANDSITHENYLRYRDMELRKNLTPALLSYVGIQYQYMAPQIFSGRQWEYVSRRLRILSGFYGILKADDGIVPYRLEMQAKLAAEGEKDLYGFWGRRLYDRICGTDGSCRILNLASKEYSAAITPYLRQGDRFVTCVFGTETDGRVKVKATEAKMARGEMVRFLAEREAEDFEAVKEFDRLGFSYCPEKSGENEYIFMK